MATYHGGDGGNEDPHKPWWKKSWGCKGSGGSRKPKVRGPNQNLNLEQEFAKKGRLSIDFDTTNLRTWHAIGENSAMYKSMIGSLVRTVPQTYASWDHVPRERRDAVIPALNSRFKLDHFIDTPDPRDPIKDAFKVAVESDCRTEYRGRKSSFKRKYFDKKGGLGALSELENAAPPEDLSPADWKELLEYYQRADRVRLSETNKSNRAKQVLSGTHGRQSYSQYVHQEKVQKDEDVDLVTLFERKHKKKSDKSWEHPRAAELYDQLQRRKQEVEQTPVPTPEPNILEDVLGPRKDHRRGIGRVLKQMGTQTYDYTYLTQGGGAQPHQAPEDHPYHPQHTQYDEGGSSQPRGLDIDLNCASSDPPEGSQANWSVGDIFNFDAFGHNPLPAPPPSGMGDIDLDYFGSNNNDDVDDDM